MQKTQFSSVGSIFIFTVTQLYNVKVRGACSLLRDTQLMSDSIKISENCVKTVMCHTFAVGPQNRPC